ncbi:MAG: V-type ATPase subunit [Candidatus Caldarchaeum sp.]|nr:V-type ATPase subunit [Candidatus Caldarchaeum sp.]MDW8359829.1 V-type ATPase subunit [Candidatus Caldarchaeum sp.]
MKLEGDPVYAVAKAYALKSLLLPFSVVEELSDSASLSEFVERLRTSPYGANLAQLPKPYTALDVEKAFWRHLVAVHYSLSQTATKPHLLKQYLMRYVYFNMKTILKAKALNRPVEEILKTVDLYPETLLAIRDRALKAASAKTLSEALAELVRTELSSAASSAVSVWESRRDFSALEAVVDKMYVEGLLQAFKKTPRSSRRYIRPFVSMDVDVYALTTALRARVWRLTTPQTREFLPSQTFDVKTSHVESLLAAEDLKTALDEVPKPEYLERVSLEEDPHKAASQIEENARAARIRYAVKSFYKTPYQQSVLISLLVLKEVEVRNLSTIAKNIEEGVSDPAVISRLLVKTA